MALAVVMIICPLVGIYWIWPKAVTVTVVKKVWDRQSHFETFEAGHGWRWKKVILESGDQGTEPSWPKSEYGPLQRDVHLSEEYVVSFQQADGGLLDVPVSFEEYNKYIVGQKFSMYWNCPFSCVFTPLEK